MLDGSMLWPFYKEVPPYFDKAYDKVNNDMGHFLQTQKGLNQGTLLSLVLFSIAADILAVLIGRSNENG